MIRTTEDPSTSSGASERSSFLPISSSGQTGKISVGSIRRPVADVASTSMVPIRFAWTREGFHFTFLILFVMVGAIIRNANLLVVLAGILSGILFLQWRICTRVISNLRVTRKVPFSAQARRPFRVTLQLKNQKSWLGSWLIEIQDRMHERGAERISRDAYRVTTLFPRISPLSNATVDYECECTRRGVVEFGPLQMSSIFPWGLMRSHAKLTVSDQCLVFPTIGHLHPSWRDLFEVRRMGAHQTRSQSGPSEGEFYGLRNYRVGDSPRWIHWRTTARRNELVVRQFERQENLHASILLDLHRPTELSADEEDLFEDDVDAAIEFAATVANLLVGRGGGTLSIAVSAKEVSFMDKIQSRNQFIGLMEELSFVEASVDADWRNGVEVLANSLRLNPVLVVVSTRAEQWSQRQLREGDPTEWTLQRVQVKWLNVREQKLKAVFSRGSK